MPSIRDLSIWLPALEAQLQDAPTHVDLVEFTGTVGKGSISGSYRLGGNTYDWMTQPAWAAIGGLDDALYLDDLKAFPRTPGNIPGWYPKP